MSKARQQQKVMLTGVIGLVLVAAIGVAFVFGKTSPVIASGKVILKPELIQQAQGMRTLYIIVRDSASPMPMPLGAMATTLSADPSETVLEFKLTKDNLRMMTDVDAQHPAKINVKARLDMDGLGGADAPGDIVGVAELIDWGTQGITIELDQLVTADAELQQP
jgi:hypothetical protein